MSVNSFTFQHINRYNTCLTNIVECFFFHFHSICFWFHMTIYKSYCFPHSFSSSILFSLPLCIWRVGSPHPNEDTRTGLEHHLRIYHFRSHHILVLLPGFMLLHFPSGWIVYWELDLNIPAMICASKGGRVELTFFNSGN